MEKKEEKKLRRESEGEVVEDDMSMNLTIPDNNEKAQWYFYNKQLVSQGLRTFKQKWGERELKDYWRFSNEISSLMSSSDIPEDTTDIYADEEEGGFESGDSIVVEEVLEEIDEQLVTDPTTREFYTQQIPDTDEKKEAAKEALRNALFETGVRFKDNVGDKNLTISYLEFGSSCHSFPPKLVERPPLNVAGA